MNTFRDAWARLKAQLDAAMKSKAAPGAKADPKKVAQAIQKFMSAFAPVMTDLDSAFKLKAQADAAFKKAGANGMNLVTPILQQVVAAHKDGFNADNTLQGNMEDRLDEVFRLLKELKQYGSEVQWG